MAYSRQRTAISSRRQYSPAATGARPPYYPKLTVPEEVIPPRQYPYSEGYDAGPGAPDLNSGYYRGMNKNDMIAAQEEGYYENLEREKRGETPLTEREIHQGYINKYKIPDDELTRLKAEAAYRLPAGDMDISQGMAEGQTNLSGFPALDSLNKGSIAQQQGDVKGAISNYGKSALQIATLPAQIPYMIAKPPIDYVKSKIKGLFASDTSPGPQSDAAFDASFGLPTAHGPLAEDQAIADAPLGPTTDSGSTQDAALGLPGPHGPMAQDLADIDIGGFGDDGDDGGLGGGPGGTPGGLSGGVGTW